MDNDKKIINDLKHHFFIPDYQRGYRWTEAEVTELLDDIWEFDNSAGKKYCLQTLMVIEDEKNSRFEVVDGQQRLTTIFIVLSVSKRYNLPFKPPYSIEYQTRVGSKTFLENISDVKLYDGEINDSNIDYFHITGSFRAVEDWLDAKSKGSNGVVDSNTKMSVLTEICTKILNNVFFIYYPLPDSGAVKEVFRKVNLGKIPLSNSELIKAIIFNKDNFESNAEIKQQELSLEWNRLERELENESFWWFIIKDSNESEKYVTRLDYLFELVLLKRGHKLDNKNATSNEQKQYASFSIYYSDYKKCNDKNKYIYIKNLWQDINELYEQLQEWYKNLNLYHIIGYLISAGISIKELMSISAGKKKSAIIDSFVNEIKKRTPVKNIITKDSNGNLDIDESDVNYSNEKKDLRLLFLFLNVATLITKNNKEYRFPFDLYKKEKWDIEHIHATADDTANADDEMKNLTLLDIHTNREFQNAPFDLKRKHIINKDKEGRFIPICTKNVYLKEYTDDIANTEMDQWEDEDKEDYIKALKSIAKDFFEGSFEYGDFIRKQQGKG